MCKRDLLFWLNTFLYTYNPKDHPSAPQRLFLSYAYQDTALAEIQSAIGDHDFSIAKSRDMGATWMQLMAMLHRWQFYDGQRFLAISRTADYVDKTGDAKSLFWKLDYALKYQPYWLKPHGFDPRYHRLKYHLENPENGSIIDGEATTADLGRGDRLTAIFLDEHASLPNAESIERSTRDATNCRLYNSTPKGTVGIGATFNTKHHSEFCKSIDLHWSLHPTKAAGLYTTERGRIKVLDESYKFPKDFRYEKDKPGKHRSPWYDEQCRRAASAQEVAQELDIDFLESGSRFFAEELLAKLEKNGSIRKSDAEGLLDYTGRGEEPEFVKAPDGPFRIWHVLSAQETPPDDEYSIGIDVAAGTDGDLSSNSVASVFSRTTGVQVAEFVTKRQMPHQFAEQCVAMANWYFGAYIIWEDDGAMGKQFRAAMRTLGYFNIYYREATSVYQKKKTRQPGFISQGGGKAKILGQLAKGLRDDSIVLRSGALCNELREFVFINGEPVHSGSVTTEDPSAKGRSHGDRGIAAALAWEGILDRPSNRFNPRTEEDPHPDSLEGKNFPPGTMGFRLQRHDEGLTASHIQEYVF